MIGVASLSSCPSWFSWPLQPGPLHLPIGGLSVMPSPTQDSAPEPPLQPSAARTNDCKSPFVFIGGTSPVLFEPVYRQAGLGYPRGEIDRQEAFSRRPGATPPPATLLATARKGKPGQSQGRNATGPRFLPAGVSARTGRTPRSPGCRKRASEVNVTYPSHFTVPGARPIAWPERWAWNARRSRFTRR